MDAEELLRAAMAAEKAGNIAVRDELVRAAEKIMKPRALDVDPALVPPRADAPGQSETPKTDKFGPTISAATREPIAAMGAYWNALTAPDQSQSPTMNALPDWVPAKPYVAAAGDFGGLALSALGTGYAAGAGLIGETFGGSPTNEKKLARDLMMMGQVAAPELAGVSGASLGGKAATGRPLSPKQVAAQAAKDVGVTPSLAMTGKTGAMVSAGLEKFPFAGGIIARDAARAVGEVEGAFAKAVANIGNAVGPLAAGDKLQAGLKAFVEGFRTKSTELYSKVDKLIPPETRLNLSEASKAIAEQKRFFAENPELAKKLGLNNWDAIMAEAQANGVPWEAVKMFRSEIGKAIGEGRGALGDEATGRLKMLYGALTADMEAAAKAAGPEAYRAWRRANGHYKAGANRIETYLDKTISADSPERAFEAFVAITKADRAASDITRMRRIKASMEPQAWKDVSASIIDRLGKAKPGQQTAEGDAFSATTFLTEWNKMSDEAKAILLGPEVRDELSKIAKVSESVKAGNAERNTSNTANAENWGKVAVGATIAPGTTTTAVLLTNVGARALTNPYFLRAVNAYQRGDKRLISALAEGSGPFSADAKAVLGVVAANQSTEPAPRLRAVQ